MVVRIRLARFGTKRKPVYNIVIANARTARNSKPLEVIGTFNPKPQSEADGEGRKFKQVQLDLSRAKYWLGVGAQPSDPAWKLLSMAGLLEPKLSDTINRERAKKMDAIYRGEISPESEPVRVAKPTKINKGETTEEMIEKLKDLNDLF